MQVQFPWGQNMKFWLGYINTTRSIYSKLVSMTSIVSDLIMGLVSAMLSVTLTLRCNDFVDFMVVIGSIERGDEMIMLILWLSLEVSRVMYIWIFQMRSLFKNFSVLVIPEVFTWYSKWKYSFSKTSNAWLEMITYFLKDILIWMSEC